MEQNSLVLGVAGSFGSGCTTLAKSLVTNKGFKMISLTDPIREEYTQRYGNQSIEKKKKRGIQQDIGNELRKNNGFDYLAKKAIEKVDRLPKNISLVFDSIRNDQEVEALRNFSPDLYLVSVYAPQGYCQLNLL